MSTLKLYGANVCPFVHRVRLTLAEKGLEYEYVAIDLRNKPDWYAQVLPTGKVPLLEHAGHRIWESAIVCEYLEDAFANVPLLPQDPGRRAQARIWIDWASSTFVPLFYKLLKGQDPSDNQIVAADLQKACQTLDQQLSQGPWLLGQELTLADLELYPWFERIGVLEHYRGFQPSSDFTHLARWRQSLETRLSVASIAEPSDFYIEQYQSYAKP